VAVVPTDRFRSNDVNEAALNSPPLFTSEVRTRVIQLERSFHEFRTDALKLARYANVRAPARQAGAAKC
jgi:hypothetical protein